MDYTDEQRTAIAARVAQGVPISVGDQNCDESCGGWDGESRRCECGNRRVAWEFTRSQDGTLTAHAEAY
jgi:hypothetical protein